MKRVEQGSLNLAEDEEGEVAHAEEGDEQVEKPFTVRDGRGRGVLNPQRSTKIQNIHCNRQKILQTQEHLENMGEFELPEEEVGEM